MHSAAQLLESPDSSGVRVGRERVGALDFAYDIRGEGEPILLLPGVTMRRIMWPDALCDALAAEGFTVIRMDNRDAGDSSRFKARAPNVRKLMVRSFLGLSVESPYRLEDMAEDAFGLMRALGYERFHVAGASMGGMIGQTMAILQSDRLLSLTSVMSSAGGRRNTIGKPAAIRVLLSRPPTERDAMVEHLVESFRVLGGGGLPFDAETARTIAMAQIDGGTSPAASARQMAAIFESSMRRQPLLRTVTTPTLVIHGSHDPLLPLRGAVATARHIAGAELLVVRGMGHDFPAPVLPQLADAIAQHARKATRTKKSKRPALDLPRAARALRALVKDPDDLPQVFALVESLSSESHFHDLRARFAKTESGRRILRDKPDIVRVLSDRERLRQMPEGSLGRAYLAFVESESISAEGIRDASETAKLLEPTSDEIAYVADRMRDTHDLWHAVTGYRGDVLGEIGLLSFYLAQRWNTAVSLIVLAAIVKGIGRLPVVDIVRDGWRRGREAEWLPPQEWEALLERPLDEVRARLKLGTPPSYTPLRSDELRAMGVVG